MTDKRVTSIITTYQQLISAKPYVPSSTNGLTLGASGATNMLFIVFLFSDHDGVQFLKFVGLIPNSIVC